MQMHLPLLHVENRQSQNLGSPGVKRDWCAQSYLGRKTMSDLGSERSILDADTTLVRASHIQPFRGVDIEVAQTSCSWSAFGP